MTITTANEKILDRQILHAIQLERLKSGTVRRMIALLNKAEGDLIEQIAKRMARIEQRGFDLGKTTTKRLNALLESIKDQRTELYITLRQSLRDELLILAQSEVDFQIRLSETTIGATLELSSPSKAQLRAIVTAQPFRGRILRQWAGGLAANDVRRVSDAIKIGMVEGETTDQIIRRIRGTRRNLFRDGILETSRRETSAVVRTSINHTANRAREEMWKANADVIKGVQWVSTLDGRTSAICQARDGEIYPVNSGPRPPAHFNCRSVVVAAFDGRSIEDTRASEIGPVPQSQNYEQWLRKQSKATQEDILGIKKAKLFRDGDLSLDRFVDQNGKELSLEELRQRNREVFKE